MAVAVGKAWTLTDRGDGRGDMLPASFDPVADWNARSQAAGVLLADNFSGYNNDAELHAANAFQGSGYTSAQLSTDAQYVTSGKACLMERLPTDGQVNASWNAWLSGQGVQIEYPRLFVQFVCHVEADDVDWPFDTVGGDPTSSKYCIIDYYGAPPTQNNEIVIDNRDSAGFLAGYVKGPASGDPAGTYAIEEARAGTPCSGSPSFVWQPAIDRGVPANPATCGEYQERYGPTWPDIQTPVSGSRVSAQGLPDSNALVGGVSYPRNGGKFVVEVFFDFDTQELKIWSAEYGQAPEIWCDDDAVPYWTGTTERWDHIMLTNFNSDGVAEPGRPIARRAYCEVLSSTDPINFPGGFVPPSLPAPSSAPAYVQALADYEVAQLTTATGFDTMRQATDAAGFSEYVDEQLTAIYTEFSGGVGVESQASLYINGAGHPQPANGLYRYDFNGDALPNGFTLMPNSMSALADAVMDSQYYADGKPAAVHTYDGMTYDATLNWIFRQSGPTYGGGGFGGDYNYYDLNTNQWSGPGDIAGEIGGKGLQSAVDPVTRKIFVMPRFQFFDYAFYDVVTDVWQTGETGQAFANSDRDTFFIDTRRNYVYIHDDVTPWRLDIDFGTAGQSDAVILNQQTYSPE